MRRLPIGAAMFDGLLLGVRGIWMLCPPLLGLALLAVLDRLVPPRHRLLYTICGLLAIDCMCWWIVQTHPASGPDFGVITSGLFCLLATPVVIGLVAVRVQRRRRTRRLAAAAAADEPAATTR